MYLDDFYLHSKYMFLNDKTVYTAVLQVFVSQF